MTPACSSELKIEQQSAHNETFRINSTKLEQSKAMRRFENLCAQPEKRFRVAFFSERGKPKVKAGSYRGRWRRSRSLIQKGTEWPWRTRSSLPEHLYVPTKQSEFAQKSDESSTINNHLLSPPLPLAFVEGRFSATADEEIYRLLLFEPTSFVIGPGAVQSSFRTLYPVHIYIYNA